MATAIILDFAGGTAEQYDQVQAEMDLGGKLPGGALFHAAGPTDDGWRVVDVWEDMGRFQQFAEEHIGPKTQAVGLPEPNVQTVEVDELFDERNGGDGGISLVQIVRLDGMTKETFEANDALIRENKEAPDGCMFHVNGWTDTGWLVADAWTSRDARDAFISGKVMPAMQQTGTPPPVIEDLDIHNTLSA